MTALKSRIGFDRDSEEFRTNTRRLAQFAEAIGDTNPAHLEGRIASPVFNHVPVMQSMVEVLNRVASGFIMHGEHDFHFHAPIVPGQRLFSASTLTGIRSSPAGALYLIRSDTRTQDGRDICTQYATCLIQKRKVAQNLGKKNPEKPEPPRTGKSEMVTYPIAGDLTLKYGEAARDYSPYTIDPAVAHSLGLPAPIVHGMCTLALISRAVVDGTCRGDTSKLKRLGCRFSHPLYLTPGQQLVASLWAGKKAVAFEATDGDGNVVVKNGFAEVA